jgi:peptidoglycan/LPS O-acetylase OafA/YrhL
LSPPLQDRRHNSFDLLRLIAAWLVLFSHSYPLSGSPLADPFARTVGIDTLGGLGVAIFFVISGYLVTQSRERSHSISEFALKRSLRIFPALIVVTLLSAFVLGPMLTTLPLAEYLRHEQTYNYLKNATAWSIHFALPGVFVGNPAGIPINGSLWSLPYEIRCYIALVILWFLPLSKRWLALVLVVTLLILLCIRPAVPPATPFDKFLGADFYTIKLGLYFSGGAVFYLWQDRMRPSLWLGIALITCALLMQFSNLQTALFAVGFASTTLALGIGFSWLPKLPEKMGDWSYGLYLYGFPVQQTLSYLGLNSTGIVAYTLLCTIASLLLAGLSWFLIEKPVAEWWRLRCRRVHSQAIQGR